jgi:hypothetical protein
VASTDVFPQLSEFGTCRSCGQRIAWVRIAHSGRSRPVDPEPKPNAEYALLRDGRTVVNLRRLDMDLDLVDRHEGPCFWDHAKTCSVPGMTTTRAILEDRGGYKVDPERESARARLLAAGRSPWVKRNSGS